MKIEQSFNVYEALGFADPEAMQEKARLAHALTRAIENQQLTRQQAAARLGMAEDALHDLLRGHFRDLGISDLQSLLERIGQ